MRGVSLSVIADDLTGASELAAIALRSGSPATVVTSPYPTPSSSDTITVFDSDSRLKPEREAASAVDSIASRLRDRPNWLVYKKIDSVLRGNVVAESVACAKALGLRRALVLPANPSLGRVIRDGIYWVDGVPLATTAFAHDPHHPAKSSRISDLLSGTPEWPVSVVASNQPLPDRGIVVGEVSSVADLAAWVKHIDSNTLPVGGAQYFSTWLDALGARPAAGSIPLVIDGPTLIVSGSTATGRAALVSEATASGWPLAPMPASVLEDHAGASDVFKPWITALKEGLSERGIAVAPAPERLGDHDAADRIRQRFAELVDTLHRQHAFRHLVIEGGATAAQISRTLGWSTLDALGEWSTGVVVLKPQSATDVRMTMKPGSYRWPDSLRRCLMSHAHAGVS